MNLKNLIKIEGNKNEIMFTLLSNLSESYYLLKMDWIHIVSICNVLKFISLFDHY